MSKRLELQITMELRSDVIFGSGHSIPGGEDIAVCVDNRGWPYLKGSTFKGLLRESLEDLLSWTGGTEADLEALMGVSGRVAFNEERRIHMADLTLENPPEEAEDCFSTRTFTALEGGGTVKAGSLRTARCIRRGLCFAGTLECSGADEALVKDALRGIKWAGTLRSRGFGRVRVRGEAAAGTAAALSPVKETACIRFRLRTESPLIVTDLDKSSGNGYETRDYIPGSALRGLVINELASRMPDWFEEHRRELLSEDARFLDALPLGPLPAIPSLMGFYEDKAGGSFHTVLASGEVKPGCKRAKLGRFCGLRGDTVVYWSAAAGGRGRIKRETETEEQTQIYQTRSIDAGQEFEGYVLLRKPELAGAISGCLNGTLWLGADRFAGFGKCRVTELAAEEQPRWLQYAVREENERGETLYLLALSPFTMQDASGNYAGLDAEKLAKQLGVDSLEVELCSTAFREYGGYNRTWGCRESALRMYDRGSLFKLRCSEAPTYEALRRVMAEGLGVRRAEGYGQVLFLRSTLFEGLRGKEKAAAYSGERRDSAAAVLRRARYSWVMSHARAVSDGKLSQSQAGTLQALCEKSLARGGDTQELERFLDKNLNQRGAMHGDRFKAIEALVREVLAQPLGKTLGVSCRDSMEERLRLLILLFDHSRKEES